MKIKTSFFFAWFDLWIGIFFDQKKRILYVCPLPCCVFKFEAIEHVNAADRATRAATLSGLYNCEVCGQEKCVTPGICDDCLAPPTEFEINQWAAEETPDR